MKKNVIALFSLGLLIALAACAPKELESKYIKYDGEKDAVYTVVLEAVSEASVEFESDNWVVSQDDMENGFLEVEASMCCLKNFIGISWGKRYETALSVKLVKIKGEGYELQKGIRINIKGGLNTAAMADRIWESLDAEFPRVKPPRYKAPGS
jgi:hypothetical protein